MAARPPDDLRRRRRRGGSSRSQEEDRRGVRSGASVRGQPLVQAQVAGLRSRTEVHALCMQRDPRVRGRAARTQPLGGSGTEPPSLRPVGSVGHRKAIGSSRHIGLRWSRQSVGTWCMVVTCGCMVSLFLACASSYLLRLLYGRRRDVDGMHRLTVAQVRRDCKSVHEAAACLHEL